ncbi:MarR family winged helix-turn-helix transcriptional regulator [Billgrantia endophytica]|uniref:MarR family transcriptional regulator n=1 Tax=Billgrantia endophytica TaxID=2033802 RepID=A0A2N7U825_9GAMM|nr:helix-turn-helix domain-containing protein [Halomonas endophytica]PMR76573.1 MarR family transcriptional regulator [Halomonas endophytica]
MTLEEGLKRLERHMWDLWRQHSQHSGSMELTNSELDYLYALLSAPEGLRLTELAALMRVSKASASVMVSKLGARGYLRKTACPADRRATRLYATIRTQHLEVEERDVYASAAASLREALDEEEVRELSRLLEKASRGLK